MQLNIPVILGSIREGRRSLFPARLINEKIKELGHESVLVDFLELPLPFFNSPLVPVQMNGKYPHPNVQKWSDVAYAADAFVIVSPEYNHGYSAVLKNALDWLFLEFDHKPVGLVGVSDGIYAGARAIEQLRPVLENFNMHAMRETVMFGKAQDIFDAKGVLLDEAYLKRINSFLDKLVKSAEIMKPYPRPVRPK